MSSPLRNNNAAFAIREMREADIPAVSRLAAHIWRLHYAPDIVTAEQIEYMLPRTSSEAAITRQLGDKKQRYWLLHEGNTLLAYIGIEPRENGVWFIDKLYVDTGTQRKGLGSMLLEHVTKELRPSAMTLRVNRKNYKAINFYFRHGFAIEGLDALDIGGGFVMDDFLMRKVF